MITLLSLVRPVVYMLKYGIIEFLPCSSLVFDNLYRNKTFLLTMNVSATLIGFVRGMQYLY